MLSTDSGKRLKMFIFNRNECSTSSGMSVQYGLEYAIGAVGQKSLTDLPSVSALVLTG